MPSPIVIKLFTDPPEPGMVKLRIKSDGEFARVFAFDSDGVEREVENVTGLVYRADVSKNFPPTATIEILAPEADIEVVKGSVVATIEP